MKLALPSGRVVVLDARRARANANGNGNGNGNATRPARRSAPEAPRLRSGGEAMWFDDARALFRDEVEVRSDSGTRLDVDDLRLVDFHALRAIAAHEDWLDEEEVEVPCINCRAPLRVKPAHAMPLGPFLERALDDPELDRRLEPDVPHPITPIGTADTIVLREVTVGEAAPLHRALTRTPLVIDGEVVRAMGIVALGDTRDPSAIAELLNDADDDAFDDVARAFLELHYPLRLFGVCRCEACGARNDVDAPFDRELGFVDAPAEAEEEARPFVKFRTFAAKARAFAKEIFGPEHESMLVLLVEGGVAAVDEGGMPLLGSYVPASPGDPMNPSRSHEIAVYYRTFQAIWEEEGPYDWAAELEETLEHEYEHFEAELRGGDPVDEEERREIAAEAIRIHGKSTLLWAEIGHLGRDVGGFLGRTWILWLLIVLVALLAVFAER